VPPPNHPPNLPPHVRSFGACTVDLIASPTSLDAGLRTTRVSSR
jgi:hypothetical protein